MKKKENRLTRKSTLFYRFSEYLLCTPKEQKGLGHAIYTARQFIGNEPFAVLLGDDIVESEEPAIKQLMNVYEETGHSVIGVQEVPGNVTHRYGIIDPLEKQGRRYEVKQFVENPNKVQHLLI